MSGKSLSRNTPFWTLWTGQAISFLGSAVSSVALAILVFDRTGSGLDVAVMMLARNVPALAAPAAGVISDRLDRRLVMVAGNVSSAGLIGAVALTDTLPLIYALVALLALASGVTVPAGRASIPQLVRPEDLSRANSLHNIAWTSSLLAGSALGGILVAAVGVKAAFIVDAGSFMFSAALVSALPSLKAAADGQEASSSFREELKEGFRFALTDRLTFTVICTGFLLVFFAGSVNPVSVVLAKDVLHGGDVGYGALRASWAGGMFVASAWLIAAGQSVEPRWTYLSSLLLMSAGLGLAGSGPSIAWACGALALGGTGNGLDSVSMNTLLQGSSPGRMQARVFGLSYATLSLAQVLALPVGGGLAETTSARVTFWFASAGLFATWAFAFVLLYPLRPVRARGTQ